MKKENSTNEFDYEMFIRLCREYGAEVKKVGPGKGGIFLNGKPVSGKDIFRHVFDIEEKNVRG